MLFGMQFFGASLVSLGLLCCGSLAQAQAPTLAGIAHVAIRSPDLGRTVGFYQKLGFEQTFAFSKDGATTEPFLKVNDRQFIEVYPSQTDGFMHVCFRSRLMIHDPDGNEIVFVRNHPGDEDPY
jgi:catechol 2,3-dioxygenase-like lactoylglutathione lyase family enzyme